jgi:hypothetical protein
LNSLQRFSIVLNVNLEEINTKFKRQIIVPDIDAFILKILLKDAKENNQFKLDLVLFLFFNDNYKELKDFIETTTAIQTKYSKEFAGFLERAI